MATKAGASVLKQGAKRDPELYILGAIMTGVFGVAGYYFASKPTTASSHESVAHPRENSMPWHSDDASATYKYKYHPHGDFSKPPKEAPSALHSVIIPDVELPKALHEKFNKFGKEDW
ncbi:hypothetical protein H072_9653 [Dactylellina haptotyla CBS 200.50]|uniref:Uncharacterized protein n=1 Tax=Dactylellina haptotyla (strain CBS 200.50) TaxID=1284197 RepID=S8A176_DACHA|nr:hypothetical protein H072_9653 [Dactylellina haptotyla CBS 200.50]